MSSRRSRRRIHRPRSTLHLVGRLVALAAALVVWLATLRPTPLLPLSIGVFAFAVIVALLVWLFRRHARLRDLPRDRSCPEALPPEPTTRVIPTDSNSIAHALQEQELRYAPPSARIPSGSPQTESPSKDQSLAEKLAAIDWFQFERLMARAYEKLGYVVERRGGAHADDGIDLVLHRNGESIGVQCKHWRAWKVNPKTIREMLGAIMAARLRAGIILCWCGFTQEGHAKAAEYGITLIDAPGILRILESVDARFDPEMKTLLDDQQKFCPRCESPMMLRTATKGPQAGESFWGCSRYPRCDGTIPVR